MLRLLPPAGYLAVLVTNGRGPGGQGMPSYFCAPCGELNTEESVTRILSFLRRVRACLSQHLAPPYPRQASPEPGPTYLVGTVLARAASTLLSAELSAPFLTSRTDADAR